MDFVRWGIGGRRRVAHASAGLRRRFCRERCERTRVIFERTHLAELHTPARPHLQLARRWRRAPSIELWPQFVRSPNDPDTAPLVRRQRFTIYYTLEYYQRPPGGRRKIIVFASYAKKLSPVILTLDLIMHTSLNYGLPPLIKRIKT